MHLHGQSQPQPVKAQTQTAIQVLGTLHPENKEPPRRQDRRRAVDGSSCVVVLQVGWSLAVGTVGSS